MTAEERDRELERELHRAELRAVREAFGTDKPVAPAAPAAPARPAPRVVEQEELADADLPDPLEAEVWALTARTRTLESHLRRAVVAGIGVGAAAVSLGALALVLALMLADSGAPASARNEFSKLSVGELVLRGGLEVVDDRGKRLAFLGREPSALGSSSPVALGLYDGKDGQAVRIAASPGGAALSLQAPGGTRSVSIVAFPNGAQLDVKDGERGAVLSAEGARANAPAATTSAAAR